MLKIIDIIIEPNKVYTNSNFKLKIKATGIYKAYRYKDYNDEKYKYYDNQKYKDIKKWEVI